MRLVKTSRGNTFGFIDQEEDMPKDQAFEDLKRALEERLATLDALLQRHFPVGGHATVEAAQGLVNECRKLLKGA